MDQAQGSPSLPVSTSRSGPGGSVLWVRMNHGPVNALAPSVRAGLIDAAAQGHDKGVHAVVLVGNDRCFSAGGDITELASLTAEENARTVHSEYLDLYRSWRSIPVPTVAAIRGYALGGALELALSCDLRCADSHAFLAASGVTMGLVESAHSLADLTGASVAADLLFTGRRITADEALSTGLITRAFSDLDGGVEDLANSIAQHSGATLRAIKSTINIARTSGRSEALSASIGLWRKLQQGQAHQAAVDRFIRQH